MRSIPGSTAVARGAAPVQHHRRLALLLALVLYGLAAATAAFLIAGWGRCLERWRTPGSKAAEACAAIIDANHAGSPAEYISMAGLGIFIGSIGLLIALKRSQHPIGWLFLGTGLVLAVNPISSLYAKHALNEAPGSLPLGMAAAIVNQAAGGPITFVGFIFLFLLFPTGHLLSPRWRWVAAAAILGFGLTTVGGMLATELRVAPLDGNPIAWPWFQRVRDIPETVAGVLMLLSVVASLSSIVVRYRRSRGEERQQMRWMTWAAGLFCLSLVVAPIFWASPSLEPLWGVLFVIAVGAIPLASAIAILKYRLYDIDVLVNRTLVYATLTALLAGSYLLIVVLIQRLLEPVTKESDLAVAASTLAVAALFRPLKSRVQRFIDHRFYRRKYDAVQTLSRFSAHLRDQVDLDSLRVQLMGVVGETMQPAHASVWLRDMERS